MRGRFFRITPCAVLIAVLTSCSGTGDGAYSYPCPDGHLVQLSLLDLSSSGRSTELLASRLNAIQVDAERVTDCEGTLKVMAWSMSAADSALIFSGDLATKGATEIGRDRKIADAVKGVMASIRDAVQQALESIDPAGSDLTGAMSLAADAYASKDSADELEVHIYSDGVSTTGAAPINEPSLTPQQVQERVASWAPVDLNGASVTFYGVGKVGGVAQPPQDYINVVRLYANDLCEASGAICLALTTLPN